MLIGWVLGEKFQTYPGQNQDCLSADVSAAWKGLGIFALIVAPVTQASRTIWMNRGFPVHFYSFHHTNNLHYGRLLSPDFFLILTFWFKWLLICAEEVRRELQDWVSTCVKHAGGFVWFGAAFQSVVSEIFPEFMELRTQILIDQHNLESVWLTVASFFIVTIIPNTASAIKTPG